MRIYFFGGSFDPPHKAHKLIYKYCLDYCDQFIFFPSKCSPGKDRPKVRDIYRLEMLKQLIDKNDLSKVRIDDFELINGHDKSFTINTIHYLEKKFKNSTITMVIGYDQYKNLKNWKDYNEILASVDIVCFKRGHIVFEKNSSIKFIEFNYDISSTKIRAEIRNNNISKTFLNSNVYDYIINNDLYKV